VERLAFFSDAVFAIAITLLIIEFKVPEISHTTTKEEIWQDLVKLAPNIAALLGSFYLIATYWMRHHFLFKHIHNYNGQIVVMNLIMLLPTIFLPFSTAFFANAYAAQNGAAILIAMRVFLINHILVGLCLYVLYLMAIVWHKEFSFRMEPKGKVKFTMDTLYQTIALLTLLVVITPENIRSNPKMVLATCSIVALGKRVLQTTLKRRFAREEAAMS
jgi:uncharacterized membrane protein